MFHWTNSLDCTTPCRFITEAVFDLKDRLRALKSDLLISAGLPETVVKSVVSELQAQGDQVYAVLMSKEVSWVASSLYLLQSS